MMQIKQKLSSVMKVGRSIKHKDLFISIIFFAIIAGWFALWARHISMDFSGILGGPDEGMRYMVPKFISEHHSLPTGYNKEVIFGVGNWSYAFYPQFLGAIVSALFMNVMSVIHNTPHALLFAARMTSVLFATVTVLMVGKSLAKLFDGHKYRKLYSYVGMILLAAWPQFAFLAGYVNNDIIAMCGVSFITYAGILHFKGGWSYKNASVLLAGVVICLLGYTNSYGFILFGGLYFAITLLASKYTIRHKLQLLVFVVGGVLLLAGPFFVRNAVIYQGDFIGIKTFKSQTVQWEAAHHIRIQTAYGEVFKKRSIAILTDRNYATIVSDSFVGKFGAMAVAPESRFLVIYTSTLLLGLFGLLWMAKLNRSNIYRNKSLILLIMSVVLACLTTVALSLYYTLKIDYQPQGRYVIYLLVPSIVYGLYGINFIMNKVVRSTYRKRVIIAFTTIYIINTLIIFYLYMLRYVG